MINVINFWVCMCFLCGECYFILNKYWRKWFILLDFCCLLLVFNFVFFVVDFDIEVVGSSWNVRILIIYLVNREIVKGVLIVWE